MSGSSKRLSIKPSRLTLPGDPQRASQEYIDLRASIRDAFESFLRNLNLKSLHNLEQEFERHGGDLNSSTFLKIFEKVFPEPVPQPNCSMSRQQKRFVQQMACLTLFECVDVDQSGEASWMEFVEFVCAIAEELRMQAAEESGQTFDFHSAEQVAVPFRPAAPKCHFDQLFFWPDHPSEAAVVFEEGQAGFHIHRPKTLARKRKIEGHHQELLSATFLPEPFRCTVTSGNDNLICFWDENFNLIRKWTLDHTWTGEKGKVTSAGVLCWCHEIQALYAADHFSEKVRAWRIRDMDTIRAHEAVMEPDKRLSLTKHSTHTKAVQAICWMGPLKCLATASLDTTVQIFDLVQMKRTHVLAQHKRGLTCLQYCAKNHMLISGGFDNYINIWDPGAGTLSFTLEGHECSIAGICAMPDTDYEFMSVDFEGQVRLWDVRRLVCLQNFCATDRQAEKNGEIEALEPRAICPLNRDRVLISGRRMVVFDREASDPRVTADWPINAVAFNERRIEIVTPIKNDLYVWCALTGQMRTVHDNVIEGTITALTIGLGCRRVFVGADDGEIIAVNYACGALLKKLSPHAYEVNQITCIPEKVLTLSVPEKVIVVHDDNDPERAAVLKRIDVSGAGSITQFAFDGRDIIAGTSEEQTVVWYNMAFGKEVSNTGKCEVSHNAAVPCCIYFQDAPLLATADAEGAVIFWSVPPLRTYSFFSKLDTKFGDSNVTYSISALALSWPDEEFLYAGVERGNLACINIRSIVENAKTLRTDILRRKESGEAAEVISGRIFDAMPKPCDSPEYCKKADNVWLVEKAHRGSIDRIVVCRRKLPVVLTLGSDACVRIWSHATGEALGTLEQGLPEGLSYERETTWRFPMDAQEELQRDLVFITEAAAEELDSDESETEKRSDAAGEVTSTKQVSHATPSSRHLSGSKSSPNLQPAPGHSSGAAAASGRGGSKNLAATTGLGRSASGAALLQKGAGAPRLQALQAHKGSRPRGDEWYAGPYANEFWSTSTSKLGPGGLPKLKSGLSRPNITSSKSLVAAARRLHGALGDIDTRSRKDYF